MNARLLWCVSLAFLAGLVNAAETNEPPAVAAPAAVVTNAPTVIVDTTTPAAANTATNASDTSSGAVLNTIAPKATLPPLLDQVVRLSEKGSDPSIIKSYVESAPAYRITGNDIIDLQDRGVPKDVILALIERSKAVGGTESLAEMVNTPPATNDQVPLVTPSRDTPAMSEDAATYYNDLAPYGSWMNVAGYGWSWQPTVVVINPTWRPYCDSGDWLWTDSGWYWNSYYSWGWAPFHYGRWYHHGGHGWLWCPDRTWGPAWVSWRNSSDYCGWAPLPPGSHFDHHGWSHHGVHVDAHHGHGLHSSDYTFVRNEHFSDRHVGRHSISSSASATAFRQTKVNNNYTLGVNNRIVNQGVSRQAIASASSTPVRMGVVTGAGRGGISARSEMAAPARATGAQNMRGAVNMNDGGNQRASVIASVNSFGRTSFSRPDGSSISMAYNSPRGDFGQPMSSRGSVSMPMSSGRSISGGQSTSSPQHAGGARSSPSVQRFGSSYAASRGSFASPASRAVSSPRSVSPGASANSGPRSISGGGGGGGRVGGGGGGGGGRSVGIGRSGNASVGGGGAHR